MNMIASPSAMPYRTCLTPGISQPIAFSPSVIASESSVRIAAPSTGPNSVPTPPMIGARMISIDRPMLKICSGNRLL
jgi:hypothetical protein